MTHEPTLSIDIDTGDIFLHFRPDYVSLNAWVRRSCEYRAFRVSAERGISIAAKAMRAGRHVDPFGPNASEVTV